MTNWTCDWHLKFGSGGSLVGPSPKLEESGAMSKQIVSELNCIVGRTVSQNCMVWGKKRTHWG